MFVVWKWAEQESENRIDSGRPIAVDRARTVGP